MGNAQAMGLHRDSSSFSLTAVETETRRRVWWYLCVLDNRISESCGLERHIPLETDTKLPLHINDSDLSSGDLKFVCPRNEYTEITVSLVKMGLAETNWRVRTLSENLNQNSSKLESLIEDQIRRYEETCLTYYDRSIQLHSLCFRGTQLVMARLRKLGND